jgi:hypothetical protein
MADAEPTDLPLPPPPITADKPPRGHRSDTVGIFAVLALSGVAQIAAPEQVGSLRDLVSMTTAVVYSATLVVFGILGLISTLLPTRMTIPALGMELAARMALSIATATYATAVLLAIGPTAGAFLVSVVFYGISALCAVAAVVIARWLLRQRRAVTAVLDHRREVSR